MERGKRQDLTLYMFMEREREREKQILAGRADLFFFGAYSLAKLGDRSP